MPDQGVTADAQVVGLGECNDGVGRRPVVLARPRSEYVCLHLVFRDNHAEMPLYQGALGRALELSGLDRDTHSEGVPVGLLERSVGGCGEAPEQQGE